MAARPDCAAAAGHAQLARQGPLITWLLAMRGRLRGAWWKVQWRQLFKRLRKDGYLK